MTFSTAELYDEHEGKVQVVNAFLQNFGGKKHFFGPISTVKCLEDNSLVRAALQEPGRGRVLVVDGGASNRCALVGDMLAEMGMKNGWAGLIIFGCIRDSAVVSSLDYRHKSPWAQTPGEASRRAVGDRDIPSQFWRRNLHAWRDYALLSMKTASCSAPSKLSSVVK